MAGNITVTTTFGFHIDKRLKLVVPTKDVYSIHVLNITVNILGDNQTYISKIFHLILSVSMFTSTSGYIAYIWLIK